MSKKCQSKLCSLPVIPTSWKKLCKYLANRIEKRWAHAAFLSSCGEILRMLSAYVTWVKCGCCLPDPHRLPAVNNNNNLCLMWLRQFAQPYVRYTTYDILQSATQGSNDTHTLSRRTVATTRFIPEKVGCQKQTAPSGARLMCRSGCLIHNGI